jgi:hypothetical protein
VSQGESFERRRVTGFGHTRAIEGRAAACMPVRVGAESMNICL